MNKQRKAKISNIKIEIEKQKEILQLILEEEQDYYDNIPENLQCSLRADDSQEAIDMLESVIDNIESAISELGDI